MKHNRYSESWQLALVNALLISSIYVIIYLCSLLFYPLKLWFLLVSTLAVCLFSFVIFKITLERFIYNKIRIIYKIIRKQKSAAYEKTNGKETLNMKSVEKEVEDWTRKQQQEIDELKRMEAYRRDFLGNISHELKTPIFNIQGYILTLLEGGIDDPSINKDYLARTEKSIDRMITIVEDLEIISRLESGEVKMHYSIFDIVQLSHEVVEMFQHKAEKNNITLSLNIPVSKSWKVNADKEKIMQAMTNLMDNSIKYGRKGGRSEISFFDMDESILVEVADDGIGIEEKYLPRLFERFYRTDKARSRDEGGSGLGLAIVKHILEAHGQTVNVRSTPGVGTTFGFMLGKAKV